MANVTISMVFDTQPMMFSAGRDYAITGEFKSADAAWHAVCVDFPVTVYERHIHDFDPELNTSWLETDFLHGFQHIQEQEDDQEV